MTGSVTGVPVFALVVVGDADACACGEAFVFAVPVLAVFVAGGGT